MKGPLYTSTRKQSHILCFSLSLERMVSPRWPLHPPTCKQHHILRFLLSLWTDSLTRWPIHPPTYKQPHNIFSSLCFKGRVSRYGHSILSQGNNLIYSAFHFLWNGWSHEIATTSFRILTASYSLLSTLFINGSLTRWSRHPSAYRKPYV
jgi:hypothetical protein